MQFPLLKKIYDIDDGVRYHMEDNPAPIMDAICRILVVLGDYPIVTAVMAVLVVYLLWHKRGSDALRFAAAFVVAAVCVEALKLLIQQPRPLRTDVPAWKGFSFPSAPAAVSVIAYLGGFGLFLPMTSRRKWIGGMIGLLSVLLIGGALIRLRHHLVSDIVCAWLLAAIVLLVSVCSARVSGPRR